MKLNKEELKQILEEIKKIEGDGWGWLDIPAYIRKDNSEALFHLIKEKKEELKRFINGFSSDSD